MGWLEAAIGGGAAIGGALLGSSSASKAAKAQERAAREQIGYARETRDLIRSDQAPYREAGYSALHQLMRLTGVPVPSTVSQAGGGRGDIRPATAAEGVDAVFRDYRGRPPTEYERKYYSERPDELQRVISSGYYASTDAWYDKGGARPYEGGITTPEWQRAQGAPGSAQGEQSIEEMVKADPSYDFRLNEGMRALERSRAAGGGLLSGGTTRGITRYAQDYASTEYGKIYDRIANIAGLGQTGAQASAQGTMFAGNVMSNAAAGAGYGRASGYVAQGNQWANALNQVAQLDWGGVFNRARPAPANNPSVTY
jgi:hypothetical protein